MAIDIGGGGLGAVYLGDTLIAGGGGGGGGGAGLHYVAGMTSCSPSDERYQGERLLYSLSLGGYDLWGGYKEYLSGTCCYKQFHIYQKSDSGVQSVYSDLVCGRCTYTGGRSSVYYCCSAPYKLLIGVDGSTSSTDTYHRFCLDARELDITKVGTSSSYTCSCPGFCPVYTFNYLDCTPKCFAAKTGYPNIISGVCTNGCGYVYYYNFC